MTKKNLRRLLTLGALVVALGAPMGGVAQAGDFEWDSIPADAVVAHPAEGPDGQISLLQDFEWD